MFNYLKKKLERKATLKRAIRALCVVALDKSALLEYYSLKFIPDHDEGSLYDYLKNGMCSALTNDEMWVFEEHPVYTVLKILDLQDEIIRQRVSADVDFQITDLREEDDFIQFSICISKCADEMLEVSEQTARQLINKKEYK